MDIFNDSVSKLTLNFKIMLWDSTSQSMDYTLRNNDVNKALQTIRKTFASILNDKLTGRF